jgi:hypothetical protein
MIPKPRINLLVYHGVFAPHAHARTDAVHRARESAGQEAAAAPSEAAAETPSAVDAAVPATQPNAGVAATPRAPPRQAGYVRRKHYAWADLLARTFAIDVLACPDCGGRLRFVATIDDRAVIQKILGHLGLPVNPPMPAAAQRMAWLPGFETAPDWLPE